MQAWTNQETYPMLSRQIARAAARAEQDQLLRITTNMTKGWKGWSCHLQSNQRSTAMKLITWTEAGSWTGRGIFPH
jgi:hypothetical protein